MKQPICNLTKVSNFTILNCKHLFSNKVGSTRLLLKSPNSTDIQRRFISKLKRRNNPLKFNVNRKNPQSSAGFCSKQSN